MKLFKKKKDSKYRVITLLGIKIRIKSKYLCLKEEILHLKQRIAAQEISHTKNGIRTLIQFQIGNCIIAQRDVDFTDKRNAISEEEYNNKVQKLYSGLNEDAALHLTKILDKKDKLYYNNDAILVNQLFNKEELIEQYNVLKFLKEPRQIDNYYQWKHYKMPINYWEPSVIYYGGGVKEIKNKNYVQNKAIIDIGAMIGDSIVIFRDYFKNEKIYSFEPFLNNYQLAKKTVELNDLTNVHLENMALGDYCGDTFFDIHGVVDGGVAASSSVLSGNNEGIKCKIETLDNYVENHNIKVGLIKIDVEGAEQAVLRGAINTIKEQKPILLISIYHNFDDFFNIKPMLEELTNNGYDFDFIQPILPNNATYEIMLLCEPKLSV